MAERIHLEVVTPERKVFEAEVERVEVPGLDGELGILPGHTELVSLLKPAGLLTYHIGNETGEMTVSDRALLFTHSSPASSRLLYDFSPASRKRSPWSTGLPVRPARSTCWT